MRTNRFLLGFVLAVIVGGLLYGFIRFGDCLNGCVK